MVGKPIEAPVKPAEPFGKPTESYFGKPAETANAPVTMVGKPIEPPIKPAEPSFGKPTETAAKPAGAAPVKLTTESAITSVLKDSPKPTGRPVASPIELSKQVEEQILKFDSVLKQVRNTTERYPTNTPYLDQKNSH